MTTAISCVVLDVDDTLFLERDYVRSGFEAIGAKIGREDFTHAAWASFERGTRGRIFDEALAQIELESTPSLIEGLVQLYRSHTPDICLLPDARACIEAWHGSRQLAVITDGPAASQRAKVAALGLASWCDPIVITAQLGDGCSKPHPEAFERVEEASGCRGAQCIYIGDNPTKDFVSPRAMGWATLRVRRAGGLHAGLPSGDDIDWEVTDLQSPPPSLRERLAWP